jgi:hypothetical protein
VEVAVASGRYYNCFFALAVFADAVCYHPLFLERNWAVVVVLVDLGLFCPKS